MLLLLRHECTGNFLKPDCPGLKVIVGVAGDSEARGGVSSSQLQEPMHKWQPQQPSNKILAKEHRQPKKCDWLAGLLTILSATRGLASHSRMHGLSVNSTSGWTQYSQIQCASRRRALLHEADKEASCAPKPWIPPGKHTCFGMRLA